MESRSYTEHLQFGEIRVVITHNPAIVTLWINIVNAYLSLPRVHPKFVFLAVLPDDQSNGSPAVLQILVHHYCLFFQLAHAPPQMPDELRHFLANSDYTFFGDFMETSLQRLYMDYQIGGNDTRRLEQRIRFMHPELTAIDWTVRECAYHQIRHRCLHGFVSYLILVIMYGVTVGICVTLLAVLAAFS